MTAHLERDLAILKDHILGVGGMVEEALERATRALVLGQLELARLVIDTDSKIDDEELAVDEACLKLLALHQPVAGDLRFLTATMKINNDLERIGDLTVNIAERALDLHGRDPIEADLHFEAMTSACRWMLRGSLDALVRGDSELARRVCARDDEVDDFNRGHFETLIRVMNSCSDDVHASLDYLTASLHLERIADLATNIAEDVVFMVEARVIRHGDRPRSGGQASNPHS